MIDRLFDFFKFIQSIFGNSVRLKPQRLLKYLYISVSKYVTIAEILSLLKESKALFFSIIEY